LRACSPAIAVAALYNSPARVGISIRLRGQRGRQPLTEVLEQRGLRFEDGAGGAFFKPQLRATTRYDIGRAV